MALKRGIAFEILAIQGVKCGDSFAWITDDVAGEVLDQFLRRPPPPGTTIEVEYGKPALYRREGC